MEDDPRQAVNKDDSAEDMYYNVAFGLNAGLGNGQRANSQPVIYPQGYDERYDKLG